MNYSKLLSVTAFAAFTLFSTQSNAFTVGLAMPTQNEDRWYNEGFMLQNKLKAAGYDVELFYGGDVDVALQQRQLVRLADQNVNVLVVGSIDGSALSEALATAKNKNIPVISYDRLITGTDAVSYYATFDNEMVGHMQGKFLVKALNLENDPTPKNIELFYGSLNDNNAKFFWKGAMDELSPYFENGQLVCKSNEMTPEQVNTPDWSGNESNKRMNALIEKVGYGPDGVKLDAILSPADCVSEGIIFALKKRGYNSSNIPVVTGQDAVPEALDHIASGELAMTIYKNPSELCDTIVKMVGAISKGEKVDINDTTTYNNGAKLMASYLCKPELLDKSNYQKAKR